ncbi:peptidylprolyl isomerase [Colwellia sp. C1TZA3]|uniref:peptidylprolyl isomerase n=1 Tax=Colwellia sp. C1TZA3 TaxID=2508879 RepID=UPI0011B9F478|nr:peptidylprolyl isomerase [Colwellia sp. C1TZA3]TWX73393.1 peptidylprolyl isomerase [Colwellia sp. C1TZA3]
MSFSSLSKIAIASLMIASASTSATIVEFTTSQGNFKVNLHDETTPETVSNFLKYINDGDYNNTIIHRTVDNFIVQGGGARFEGVLPPVWIETRQTIKNEPVFSNVVGTIAMAKKSGGIDSATSQWFINLSDNGTGKLDLKNGGFTVFGEIIENGMITINDIALVPRCDINPGVSNGFNELPMPNYSADNCVNNFVPGIENFVTIESVIIIDASINSADSLAAVKNTSLTATAPAPTNSSSGGGSIAWFSSLFIGLIALRRRFK